MTEYEYLFAERIAIMTENGVPEDIAIAEATYQIRQDMVNDGDDFFNANTKVMAIRNSYKKQRM